MAPNHPHPQNGAMQVFSQFRRSSISEYAIAAVVVAIATIAMLTVRHHLGVLNVLLVYLLIVLLLGLTTGSGPSTAMAIISFLLFDFFFIPPYQTLTIASSDHILTVFVYLGVAIVTSQLVARVRSRTRLAERESRRTTLLYELNAALITDVTVSELLNTIVEQVVRVYGATGCRILLPAGDPHQLTVRAKYPASLDQLPDRQQDAIADWVLTNRTPAGLGSHGRRVHHPYPSSTLRSPATADIFYVPIIADERPIGVLEVHGRHQTQWSGSDGEQVLIAFANQAALALERGRAIETAARVTALAESDELKSALLAAVSHDLRTPLAVIKTATSSLMDERVPWSADERSEFLGAIDEETDRLTSMVSNLLDLSRIEGGVLRPDREWYDIDELIEDVAERLRARGQATNHRFRTEIAADLPLVWLDYVEIAQVLVNLGENAIKYAGANQETVISARQEGTDIIFSVADSGPGIAEQQRTHVFDTFYRVPGTSRIPGSGIGLAIVKGIVEAHGGHIGIESNPTGGAIVWFSIPMSRSPDAAYGQ
ncbi:MAG TPA: DUF4118 domain-containing protein [Thermomicrobiales bacterium]|nr:DUF4118 domain-containing protein [Thermomicrobiales bacterium]